jgi:hypothetical protein
MPRTLTVRLNDELIEALQKASRESGRPKGEIVRQAVTAHLKKTSGSVMSRYFGTVTGPADLSTNRAYRRTWANKHK